MNLASDSVADLVAALASTNRSLREDAARELFRRGRTLAEGATSSWRQIPEIAALLSDHVTVGIAVTPKRFSEIRAAFGNPRLADVPPDQDAEEFEWTLEDDVHLDILTTSQAGGAGAIARFLGKFGEGIQQVEIVTGNVDRVTELLPSRLGVTPVYPSTREGADGTHVNFFLVGAQQGGKVLIELVENRKRA
ncbi:MAG TPA: hypothetical protein VGT03_01185 [Candidatus Acidoferrales bacterium]|nr:hypothetical protein [Candidatus Acidoferrales bacterium]